MNANRDFAFGQIVGKRERQEDAVATARLARNKTSLVLVLADGMGGHAGGDVAARVATKAFLDHLRGEGAPPSQRLAGALQAANDVLARAISANKALEGMGCTLVGATVTADRLRWISVGDSPLLLVRAGQMSRLNADHSMRSVLQDMVETGRLSAEDAARDPSRNALRSVVSGEEIDLVDAPNADISLLDGDLVLLASDGLETLSPEAIVRTATKAMRAGPKRIVADLLAAVTARQFPHQDNTSVIAYLHRAVPEGAVRPRGARRRTVLPWIALLLATLLLGAGAAWLFVSIDQSGLQQRAASSQTIKVKSDRKKPAAVKIQPTTPSATANQSSTPVEAVAGQIPEAQKTGGGTPPADPKALPPSHPAADPAKASTTGNPAAPSGSGAPSNERPPHEPDHR